MATRLDKYGRVVLPKDIREHLDLKAGEELKVEKVDEKVILRPLKKELPLHVKNGVLVFSGIATGDIAGTVKQHRQRRPPSRSFQR